MSDTSGEDALAKLELLKQMYEQDLIPAEEYRQRRKILLDAHLGGARPGNRPRQPEPRSPRRPSLLDQLKPGKVIGPTDSRFLLLQEIGGGGMGRIWKARDLGKEDLEGGQHHKALKVIAPQLQDHPRALEDLKREAIRASELSHPNVVNVYGWRQGADGWLFIVMDYLEGRDLDQVLLDEGQPGLGWERTLRILEPMVAALDHAHREHRLVHRDLKLGNVFITERGMVKLLDFGLAYRLRRSSTIVDVEEMGRSGTPVYMPPEAHVGSVAETDSVSQDIYALACMTYEMLMGDTPYSREAAIYRSPELLPNAPPMLTPAAWEVLRQGFAHDPDERPESARKFLQALVTAQGKAELPSLSDTVAIPNVHGLAPERAAELQKRTARALGRQLVFRDPLDNGEQGPALVVIPPGEFLMGSPEDEPGRAGNERRHRVLIKRPFALGQTPVTFADYTLFCEASGRHWPDHEDWGRGQRPVINVDWLDAVAYCEWLSMQTGFRYRLPTEAEWEYAARAGAVTAFHHGAELGPEQARFHGTGAAEPAEMGTVAVGQFLANAWGLHDIHGNVWEWTGSEYDEHYEGAERAFMFHNQTGQRVLRGGSWSNPPRWLRLACRFWYGPWLCNFNVGFRVVRGGA